MRSTVRFHRARIQFRTFGLVLGALERRAALEPHWKPGRRTRKLEKGFAWLAEKEAIYRGLITSADPEINDRPHLAADTYNAANALDDGLARLERKAGLAPKLRVRDRLGKVLRGLRTKARMARISAAALPAIALAIFLLRWSTRERTET